MTDAKLAEPAVPPAMSPSAAAKPARGLRQKVLDELKSVRRKSDKQTPASTPLVEPAGHAVLPPPLVLNPPMAPNASSTAADEEEEEGSGRLSSGQLSPGIGAPGKPRGCSICERSFTVFRAKHTCKVCGSRICDDCSKSRVKLNRRLERKKGSRICDPCARKFANGSTPLMSPGASPMLVPQNGLLLRRHSVPSQAFSHSLSNGLTPVGSSAVKQVDGGLAPVAAAASEERSTADALNASGGGSAVAVKKQVPHDSHLRLRHWISLAVVSALLFLRILLGSTQLPASGDDGDVDAASVSFFASPKFALARGIDSLLSIKILGCYILGLAAFDEIVRSKTQRQGAAAGGARRRRRTRSRPAAGLQPPRTMTAAASPRTGGHEPDDEVLEVDTGDKIEKSGYSLEKLIVVLEDTAVKSRAADDELKLAAFLSCCEAICVFVLVFGRATSFAGSTVGNYITSINTNLLSWPADPSTPWAERSVRALVEREVELKVANVGGKKKPSCARCVQRLLWFVEFVEACLKYTLIESADESCSAGASKAYEETIGSRHPWIIRKGVNSALGSIPSRSTILADLSLGALSAEDAVARLRVAQTHLRAIVGEIHQTFKKHDLLDIK